MSDMERTLDYVPRFDERSLNYLAPTKATFRRSRRWRPGPQLDQGQEGACVGHGVVGALESTPKRAGLLDPQTGAFGTYRLAQYIDYWLGEDYEGTSVLAGAQVAQKMGLCRKYIWHKDAASVVNTIITRGPVVIGVDWLESMRDTDEHGRLHVNGRAMGGHCVYLYGASTRRKIPGHPDCVGYVEGRNSWGPSWGRNGSFYWSIEDFDSLLQRGGEAVFLEQK